MDKKPACLSAYRKVLIHGGVTGRGARVGGIGIASGLGAYCFPSMPTISLKLPEPLLAEAAWILKREDVATDAIFTLMESPTSQSAA